MTRINTLCVILILIIMITVGCSRTQKKSTMMVDGGYRFSNIITESNCMVPDITKGVSYETIVTINQNGTTLTWSQFCIGCNTQGILMSELEGNQAKFIDMKTSLFNSPIKWNATILFSDTGFTGEGDFTMQDCEGVFTIAGTQFH